MTAARALSRAWDADVTLYLLDPIRAEWGRHTLLLCNVDGPAGGPATAVVKAAVEQDGAIFNEWAVLEWLNSIADTAPFVPDIYAGDSETELIVVEDIGGGPSLHRLLQTRPDWARDALAENQRLLGGIQGATRGRAAELDKIRGILPSGPPPPLIAAATETLQAELDDWPVDMSSGLKDELIQISVTLDVPESFQCLTFHDACPVNRILTSSGMRAIDLEMAGFRHPMIDGAYGVIGHLRCTTHRLRTDYGIALPPPARSLATDAYRHAVQPSYPEYKDDTRFFDDLTAAAAVWLVEILRRMRPGVSGDKPQRFFGVSACQRVIATLAAFTDLATTTGRLPALVHWADDLHTELRTTWPEFPSLATAAGLRYPES